MFLCLSFWTHFDLILAVSSSYFFPISLVCCNAGSNPPQQCTLIISFSKSQLVLCLKLFLLPSTSYKLKSFPPEMNSRRLLLLFLLTDSMLTAFPMFGPTKALEPLGSFVPWRESHLWSAFPQWGPQLPLLPHYSLLSTESPGVLSVGMKRLAEPP